MKKKQKGFTLIELLVTLLIISILSAVALPYAEVTVRRGKELDLKRTLRGIRTAIDRFNEDWRLKQLSKTDAGVSENGYPKTLLDRKYSVAPYQTIAEQIQYLSNSLKRRSKG